MGKKRNQANKEKQAAAAAAATPPPSSSPSPDQASNDAPPLFPSSPPSAAPAVELTADEPDSSSDDEAPLISATATPSTPSTSSPPLAPAPLDDHLSPPVSSPSSSTSPPSSTAERVTEAPASVEREPLIAPAPVHPQPFSERQLHPAIVVPTRGAADAPAPIRKRTTPTSATTAPSTVPVTSLTANAASRRAPPSSPAPAKNQLQLAAWLIALSSFLWGYGVAVLNVCIVPDAVGSLLIDINLTTEEQETATALVLVGALLSALLSGGLGERTGLKTAILLNNLFFVVGGVACALAVSKRAIFLGRFCIGLGCGVVTNTAPILLNEISPAAMRGRITSYHQLLLTIGMLMTGIFGLLVVADVPSGWRYLNGFMVVPAAFQIVMLAWIPESPFWLMKYKGKDHSRRVLMRLRDAHNRDAIEAELSDIALTMETNEVVRSAEWSDLWQYKSVLTLGTIMVFLQAMTGINTVMLYSAKIFHFAGVTNPFLATVVVGLTNVSITVLSVSLVDSQGRRPLLLRGTLLMIVSLLVLSASLLYLNGSPKWQAALAVSAVLLFVAGFAVGLGAVVWVVLADITPVEIRSRAFSFFMGTSYVCNILIAVYTLSAINFLGRGPNPEKDGIAKLYLILAGVAAVAYVFIHYRLPETTKSTIQAARVGSPSSEERSALLLPHDEQEDYDRNTTEL